VCRVIFADVQNTDRYVIRPTDEPDRWCVWDAHRDAIVFGGEDLTEGEAGAMARRLNDAYGRGQE
jgi:hypothetical protein